MRFSIVFILLAIYSADCVNSNNYRGQRALNNQGYPVKPPGHGPLRVVRAVQNQYQDTPRLLIRRRPSRPCPPPQAQPQHHREGREAIHGQGHDRVTWRVTPTVTRRRRDVQQQPQQLQPQQLGPRKTHLQENLVRPRHRLPLPLPTMKTMKRQETMFPLLNKFIEELNNPIFPFPLPVPDIEIGTMGLFRASDPSSSSSQDLQIIRIEFDNSEGEGDTEETSIENVTESA